MQPVGQARTVQSIESGRMESEHLLAAPVISVTFDLEPRDIKAFAAFTRKCVPSVKRLRWAAWGFLAVVSLFVVMTSNLSTIGGRAIAFCIVLLLLLTGSRALEYLMGRVAQWRLLTPSKQQGILCQHTISLAADALLEVTPVSETRHLWKGIYRVVDTPQYVYIFINAQAAHVIPKRAFPDAAVAQQFYERAYRLHAYARTVGCVEEWRRL